MPVETFPSDLPEVDRDQTNSAALSTGDPSGADVTVDGYANGDKPPAGEYNFTHNRELRAIKSLEQVPVKAWITARAYFINELVIESNRFYKALTDHTSGVFATDLGAGDWIEVSAPTSIGSIDQHTDVDTTSTPPVSGDLLSFDGADWIPVTAPLFGQNYQYVEEVATNISTAPAQIIIVPTLTTPSLTAGNYRLSWYYQWNATTTTNDFIGEVINNGALIESPDGLFQRMEPSDNGGAGIGGTNQVFNASGFKVLTGLSGVNVFELRFSATGGALYAIWNLHLEIFRVP